MQHRGAPQFVSAAEVSRNFGLWQDRTGQGPLVVTHHGRPRVALLAIEDFEKLNSDRAQNVKAPGLEATKLDILVEHVVGSFVALDRDFRITRLNREAVVHFGQAADELIGRSFDELYPDSAGSPVQEAMRRVADGGEEIQVDVPSTIRPDRLLRMRVFPYPDGVAIIFRNIAHEVKIEHDVHERAALKTAGDAHRGLAICRLSVRGTFEQGDAALAKIAGFAPDRLRGVRLSDLLVLKDRASASADVEAVLANGETRRFQSKLLVNGGGERDIRVALAPIREGFAVSGAVMLLTTEDGLS